jgi:aromatic-amino-acid transaminase
MRTIASRIAATVGAMTFGDLTLLMPDPLLALTGRFRADPRARKLDLGVGVYRDAAGNTPVFAAVKAAEQRLAAGQTTKSYLGCEGDSEFVALLGAAVFGGAASGRAASGRPPMAGLQTVGGTGALRLAADLLAQTRPGRRIWVGLPTWQNHLPIFAAAGLEVVSVDLFDAATQRHRPEALLEALNLAVPGDAVLLHGCCHNPTGIDPAPGFWDEVAAVCAARGLIPLVDMAYQGLGDGWSEDGAGLCQLAAAVPGLLVAYSCDKNFGLYRERVGALFAAGANAGETRMLLSHLVALARASYSMPPDHGAAVVRCILEDAALTDAWRSELGTMRARLRALRGALARQGRIGGIDLGAVADGRGMFAMLPLSVAQIDLLQAEHAIYVAPSGRINIAGLHEAQLTHMVDALGAVQRRHAA